MDNIRDYKRTGAFNYRDPFDYFHYVFKVEAPLASFAQYIKEVENLVKKEIGIVKESYEKNQDYINSKINELKAKNLNEDEIDSIIWQYEYPHIEELLEMKNYLNDIYFASLIITIYSFFERQLFAFCKTFESNQKVQIKDLSGKGVLLYKNYIEKILNITFEDSKEDWEIIKKYQQLRNFIAHDPNYRLPKNSNLLKEFKSLKGIQMEKIDNEFTVKIIDKIVFDDFLKAVANVLHDIYLVRVNI